MPENLTDALLICAQDNDWLRALVRRLIDDPERGDDIAQDAVVVALQAEPEKRRGAAWLAGVVRNLVANGKRRSMRQRRAELRSAVREPSPGAADSAARIEQQRMLAKVVLGLEQPFRDVVVLRFYDGLERREIARRLGVPIATVNSRLTRAVHRLRARLDSTHGGDRSAWLSALAPFVTTGEWRVFSGMLTMKKVLTSVVAAIALLLGGAWAIFPPGGVGPKRVADPAGVDTAPAAEMGESVSSTAQTTADRTVLAHPTAPASSALVVRVVDASGAACASRVVTIRVGGRLHDRAVTDALGRVQFDQVPEAATVSAGASGQRVLDRATTTTTSTSREIVLRLPGGLVIRGRVLDQGDRPVVDASVWLHRGGTEQSEPITYTDSDGVFLVGSARWAVVEVRKDGYGIAWSRRVEGGVGSEHEVVVRLRPCRRQLSGTVLGLDGTAVPHARIRVVLWATASLRRGDVAGRDFEVEFDADERGRFAAGWLPAGRGYVFATPGVVGDTSDLDWGALAEVDLTEDEYADTVLRATEAAAISVRVLDAAGEPVHQASVSASCRLTPFVSARPLCSHGRTGVDGRCVLRGLFATSYRLKTVRGGQSLHRELDLVAGQTAVAELRWQPAVAFEVEILDPAGRPHMGWRVELNSRVSLGRSLSGQSDARGIARLEGIVEGARYRLAVFGRSHPSLPVLRRSVVDTSVPRLTLRIDIADTIPGRLRGRFVASGEGITGRAQLVPEGGGIQSTVALAADGRFEFRALPPGGYRLSLRSDRHVFEPRLVRLEPGATLELQEITADPGVVLWVSCPGLSSAEADGLRVVLGTSQGDYRLHRDPSQVSTWNYSMPIRTGKYRLIVLGAETLPVSKDLVLVGGEQTIEFDPPAVGTAVRIRVRLLDGAKRKYGGIANGVVTIRGPGEPIVERFFCHFDDLDEKIVIRRFGLAPGRYTIEVKGIEKTVSVKVQVGTVAQDVDMFVR